MIGGNRRRILFTHYCETKKGTPQTMSFQPEAIKNLAIANDLRKRGFANLLDSQPDMRDRFTELWHEGESIKNARYTLKQEFTNKGDIIPSQSALQHYVNRYLRIITPTVVIDPYTPDYTKLQRKYDPLVHAHIAAIEAERIYRYTVKGKLSISTQLKALTSLVDINSKLYELQVKSGIARISRADNNNLALTMQQTNININTKHQIKLLKEEATESMMERFERLKI